MEELVSCLRRNIANPCICKIHVFYESKKGLWNDILKDEKITTSQIDEYPTYQMLIDYANRYLQGKVVVIANADIFFDSSLDLLREYDMDRKCLALTRYNVNPYKSWQGKTWERNYGSQDAWVFRSPIPKGYYNIRLGYLGCDGWIAWEMERAGISVTNPSMDIKIWHLHENRGLINDSFSDNRSYHSHIFETETKRPLKHRMVPIEPIGRWKIYTVYSPSSDVFYKKYFLGTMKDDFEVVSCRLNQPYKNAEHVTGKHVETGRHKVQFILKAIDSTPENGFFIFSDADMQFFSPIQGELRRTLSEYPFSDIFFQQDAAGGNAGSSNFSIDFFLCKANPRTRRFWELIGEKMNNDGLDDQDSANCLFRDKVVPDLKAGFLPPIF